MTLYDVDGAIVTDCIIEFIGDSFPNTTNNYQPVTNVGTGGAAYNGTTRLGSQGEYGLGPSGAKCWHLTAVDYDWISFPAGSLTNNLSALTCELAFYINIYTTNGAIASKCSTSWNTGLSFIVEQASGKLMMFRATTDGYIYYETPGGIFSQGHAYFVQITWDMSSTSNAPTCIVSVDGGASTTYTYPTTLTKGSAGSSTAWADDSSTTGYLGSNYTTYPSAVTLYLMRLHDVIVAPGDLTTNLNASNWRLEASQDCTVAMTHPDTTYEAQTVVASANHDCTVAMTHPDSTYDDAPVYVTTEQDRTVAMSCPTTNYEIAEMAAVPGCIVDMPCPDTTIDDYAMVATVTQSNPTIAMTCPAAVYDDAPMVATPIRFVEMTCPGTTYDDYAVAASIVQRDPGVYEENCIIKYDFNQPAGGDLLNEGNAGATYDATVNDITPVKSPNQNSWGYLFNGIDSFIRIPGGSSDGPLLSNMRGQYTYEFIIQINGPSPHGQHMIWSKSGWPDVPSFALFYTDDGDFILYRYEDINGTNVSVFVWENPLALGQAYHCFLEWDCSSISSVPALFVGPGQLTTGVYPTGNPTSWLDDSEWDATIGAVTYSSDSVWVARATIYLFRLHTEILSNAHRLQNYKAELWRYVYEPVPRLPLKTAASILTGADYYLWYWTYGVAVGTGVSLNDPTTMQEASITWKAKRDGVIMLEYTTDDGLVGYFGDVWAEYFGTFYVHIRGQDTVALDGTYDVEISITINDVTVTRTGYTLAVVKGVCEKQWGIPDYWITDMLVDSADLSGNESVNPQLAQIKVGGGGGRPWIIPDCAMIGTVRDSVTLKGTEPKKQ